MTLRYSRKSFRKVVWNTNQQVWARLHEEAFRYLGGSVRYVVLDNLREGVIKPDIYEPQLNPVYAAMPARPGECVAVRIYDQEIEIYGPDGLLIRRHRKTERAGEYRINDDERLFNPSRETRRLIERAEQIGAHTAEFCRTLFKEKGRLGQKAIYGIVNLSRRFNRDTIERACGAALQKRVLSYQAIKRMVERSEPQQSPTPLQQDNEIIRPLTEYQRFWEAHTQKNKGEENDNVHHGTGTLPQSAETLGDERDAKEAGPSSYAR